MSDLIKLAEMCRELEIPATAASSLEPKQLGAIVKAVVNQAKTAKKYESALKRIRDEVITTRSADKDFQEIANEALK